MALDHPDLLPCGRDPLAVADRASAGHPDAHEQTCPYCQAAIAAGELTTRSAGELAAATVDPPATLLPGIMRTVWAELRSTATISLPASGGSVTVTAAAVAAALRHDLDTLPDFTVHSVHVETADTTGAAETAAGETSDPARSALLAVRITASLTYPAALPPLAQQCRRIIADTLAVQFGLQAAATDIDIVDVDLPNPPVDRDTTP